MRVPLDGDRVDELRRAALEQMLEHLELGTWFGFGFGFGLGLGLGLRLGLGLGLGLGLWLGLGSGFESWL